MHSRLKGVDIMLNEVVWVGIVGFLTYGMKVIEGLNGFDKVEIYKECLTVPCNETNFELFKVR